MKEKLSFCTLEAHSDLEVFLKEVFITSKQRIKKHFKKEFRQKEIVPKQCLDLPLDFVNSLRINPNFEGEDIPIIFE